MCGLITPEIFDSLCISLLVVLSSINRFGLLILHIFLFGNLESNLDLDKFIYDVFQFLRV
jgi:hypothetical protein